MLNAKVGTRDAVSGTRDVEGGTRETQAWSVGYRWLSGMLFHGGATVSRMTPEHAYTIGYEGRSLADFVALLQDAGVNRVIDVRALPLSRKRGFSRTALKEELARHGIEYVHVRSAGNPYRDLKHDPVRCLALYAKHLDRKPEAVTEVAKAMQGRRSALLCFEASHEHCHRSVIAARLAEQGSARTVKHL